MSSPAAEIASRLRIRCDRDLQLLALAHELAVGVDELVVELEHLPDEVLLLADGGLGDHQHRVAGAAQPHAPVDRGLGAAGREREVPAAQACSAAASRRSKRVALGRLDQRRRRRARRAGRRASRSSAGFASITVPSGDSTAASIAVLSQV